MGSRVSGGDLVPSRYSRTRHTMTPKLLGPKLCLCRSDTKSCSSAALETKEGGDSRQFSWLAARALQRALPQYCVQIPQALLGDGSCYRQTSAHLRAIVLAQDCMVPSTHLAHKGSCLPLRATQSAAPVFFPSFSATRVALTAPVALAVEQHEPAHGSVALGDKVEDAL